MDDMEWTVHSNYGTNDENEIMELLEVDVECEEDDFDFDSLVIASFTKI